ncbi:MAG: response regulator [Lachnospiraceae bacterium]|nr:response regulator [Lachnospiraceae bacterium]
MADKALVVCSSETFTVRGLEMKLNSIGVEAANVRPKIKEITAAIEETGLVILYTDDTFSEASEVLVYIKDRCLGQDRKVAVIGNEAEYREVKQFIPDECMLAFYERPLKMDKFLDDISEYFDEEAVFKRRKSILIVDDDISYLKMVYDWLKDKYHVSMAGSGMQAITWLATNHADLILLDYEMPVTSGPQVLEMIKSEPSTEAIPVMFLTGKNDRASIMKVLELKPADYLLKTITKDALRGKLEQFFLIHDADV